MRKLGYLALALLVALLAAACGSTKKSSSGSTSTAAASCSNKDDLNLKTVDQLTVGTDNPAYDPWFSGGTPKGSTWKFNDPTTQKGYESAVAYAIAKQLGFTPAQVKWVVVPFEQIFKPGPKSYDFDVNQVSVTPARKKSVTLSLQSNFPKSSVRSCISVIPWYFAERKLLTYTSSFSKMLESIFRPS